jgi:hypothetical protein
MALTEQEKARIRYHLGYPGTTDAASMTMGAPSSRQTSFLLESAMDRVLSSTEPTVRDLLAECEKCEKQLRDARPQLQVKSVGRTQLREADPGKTVTDLMEAEHTRWSKRLGDTLGVPVYPWAARHQGGRGSIGSVPRAR